jgi:hypothetical protein
MHSLALRYKNLRFLYAVGERVTKIFDFCSGGLRFAQEAQAYGDSIGARSGSLKNRSLSKSKAF